MRFLSLTIVLALVAPAMMDAQTGKADFTGTWALNAEKSTLPGWWRRPENGWQ